MTAYNTWGTSWGTSWANSWGVSTPAVITELPGGGIPRRRKKKEKPKESLDLKVYLQDLYQRLYEPETLPENIAVEVRKAVSAPSLELPSPESIDFGALSAKIASIEALIHAYEAFERMREDEDEFMLMMQ